MTWQAAVFVGLAVVLAGGFAWYERTRPPARLVALVAALAALAVAGRLVFAPVPNLVATTDVALITGYALGGAPGFAVGALAAPISNIWLGQGPWTPWQMAGWGLVGIAGAGLAALGGRRLGRWPLAVACGLAALAYGALLDLSTMVTYGGEQSLDRYLALSARGIPFNAVHALGSFAIALAAGPALVRMISRYRTRLEFTWRPSGALPLLVVAVSLGAVTAPPPAADAQSTTPAARAGTTAASTSWLAGTQNSDGGFGATTDYPSSPAMTGWAMLGLEASGRNPLDVRNSGQTPVSYLRSQLGRLRSVGDLERTILALEGAGLDSRDFAGHDLVTELRDRRRGDGSIGGQVNLTAFYALALRSGGADPGGLGRSANWLRDAQNRDGGWGIQPRAPSDAESTGAALQGLAAAGAGGSASAAGVRFLRRAQQGAGGYAVGTTGVVNSQATAWAVQGLLAAGAGGAPLERALSYLEGLRASDGHIRYSRSSDQTPVWVTAQALLAIERKPFPLAAVARRTHPSRGSPGSSDADPSPAAPAPAGSASAAQPAPGGDAAGLGAALEEGPGPTDTSKANAAGDERSEPGAADDVPATGEGGAPGAVTEDEALAPVAGARVQAEPTASTVEDDGSTGPWVWGGLGALALALAGGFLWYRRRLP